MDGACDARDSSSATISAERKSGSIRYDTMWRTTAVWKSGANEPMSAVRQSAVAKKLFPVNIQSDDRGVRCDVITRLKRRKRTRIAC